MEGGRLLVRRGGGGVLWWTKRLVGWGSQGDEIRDGGCVGLGFGRRGWDVGGWDVGGWEWVGLDMRKTLEVEVGGWKEERTSCEGLWCGKEPCISFCTDTPLILMRMTFSCPITARLEAQTTHAPPLPPPIAPHARARAAKGAGPSAWICGW